MGYLESDAHTVGRIHSLDDGDSGLELPTATEELAIESDIQREL